MFSSKPPLGGTSSWRELAALGSRVPRQSELCLCLSLGLCPSVPTLSITAYSMLYPVGVQYAGQNDNELEAAL
jgi:hypothetical protein